MNTSSDRTNQRWQLSNYRLTCWSRARARGFFLGERTLATISNRWDAGTPDDVGCHREILGSPSCRTLGGVAIPFLAAAARIAIVWPGEGGVHDSVLKIASFLPAARPQTAEAHRPSAISHSCRSPR